MTVLSLQSNRCYDLSVLVAQAGEGAVYRVDGDVTILVKVFKQPLTSRDVEKLQALASFAAKLDHAAMPIEVVVNPTTQKPVGFTLPYFANATPLAQVLDSHGRIAQKLTDDLAFRVKLCRLLAEAFARIHAAHLVIGDVSDGNFLVGRDRRGHAWVVYAIDCNSFQVSLRTPRGNEFFPSGVATEQYAAPEVQPTDWATSSRSIYSDSFGFAVLAWKILFNNSHPFATKTPRGMDVTPIGQRIELRQFPFCPGTPLPSTWSPVEIEPPLAVLPVELRELFFRCFSTADPRDRAKAHEWLEVFHKWEAELTPSLPLRLFQLLTGSVAERVQSKLKVIQPYVGRGLVLATLIALAVLTLWSESTSPQNPDSSPKQPQQLMGATRGNLNRPRNVDRELFPDPIWNPSSPRKE